MLAWLPCRVMGVSDEFPSFLKKEKLDSKGEKTWAPVLVILAAVLVTALFIFLGFRFLVGAKTPREEMLGRILSASPSRQSSLLMEWMQNIDQSASSQDWKPTGQEQKELLRFVATKIPELKQMGTSPALYALHVAGWGVSQGELKEVQQLQVESLGEEGTLALGLFFLRQKDFSQTGTAYFRKVLHSQSEALRKVAAAYFAQCVVAAGLTAEECKTEILKLMADSSDEVRWNAALGILREDSASARYLESERAMAASELGKLYVLIRNGDPTLLSRFQGAALESLATEVFKAKIALSPLEMKQELKVISSTHNDLRIRNIARQLEAKFQEK